MSKISISHSLLPYLMSSFFNFRNISLFKISTLQSNKQPKKMSSKFTILMRSHRAGSIYGRVLGVITSGNQKWEDRPLWFDAYSAHPPFEEPIFNIRRPKIDEPVRKIFYPEDLERARKMFAATGDEPKHDLDSIDDQQFVQQQQQN